MGGNGFENSSAANKNVRKRRLSSCFFWYRQYFRSTSSSQLCKRYTVSGHEFQNKTITGALPSWREVSFVYCIIPFFFNFVYLYCKPLSIQGAFICAFPQSFQNCFYCTRYYLLTFKLLKWLILILLKYCSEMCTYCYSPACGFYLLFW